MKIFLKLIFLVFLVITLVFLGKEAKEFYYNYKFEAELQQDALINPDSWDEQYQNSVTKDKYKIVFVFNNGGERSYAEYFKFVAEKKGWEVLLYYHQIIGKEDEILKFDPDFMLFTAHVNGAISENLLIHRSKKYVIELSNLISLRDAGVINKTKSMKVSNTFNQVLLFSNAVLSGANEVNYYKRIFTNMNKDFYGLRLLPLVPEMRNPVAEAKSLAILGFAWDKYRSSAEFIKFIQILNQQVPTKIYGRYYKPILNKEGVYDGFAGKEAFDMIEAIKKNGIYLLVHADSHIKSKVPSMRVFEAAAANVIIISDKHPFVIEHFGDSILYFDRDASAEMMAKQVKDHFDWIMTNPDKAKDMANRANKIYLEKFTMEKDLIRIAKMHEFILGVEQQMKLSYPFVY